MKNPFITAISTAAVLVAASALHAQNAVQLPEFRYTTVNTTVSVPDRGSVVLGSIGSASDGRVERGVPGLSSVPGLNRLTGNRGIGRNIGAGTTTVTATIIDNAELDRQVLAEAAARRAARGESYVQQDSYVQQPVSPSQERALFLTSNLSSHEDLQTTPETEPARVELSHEELARREAERQRIRLAEAKQYWADGQRAEGEGKVGLAKIYYRMALNRTDGDVQQRIADYLTKLESPQSQTVATK